jgi:hypothetical protein
MKALICSRKVGRVRENRFITSSQASISHPSVEGSIKRKMVEWLEVVVSDRGSGFLIS